MSLIYVQQPPHVQLAKLMREVPASVLETNVEAVRWIDAVKREVNVLVPAVGTRGSIVASHSCTKENKGAL